MKIYNNIFIHDGPLVSDGDTPTFCVSPQRLIMIQKAVVLLPYVLRLCRGAKVCTCLTAGLRGISGALKNGRSYLIVWIEKHCMICLRVILSKNAYATCAQIGDVFGITLERNT